MTTILRTAIRTARRALGATHAGRARTARRTPLPSARERRRPPTAPELAPHREVVRRELAAYAARIRLGSLVREHGSPLLVLDTDRVTTQLLALRRELPDVQLHFAMTALPHPAVIRAVDAFGASFSVASRGEIDLLERESIAIGRCLHTHPVKTVADITGAYLRGIRTFVVDSPAEVGEVPRAAGCRGARAAFVPEPRGRVRPVVEVRRRCPTMPAPSSAHCLREGLRVAGFTFHVGSQTTRPNRGRAPSAARSP